MSLDLPTLRFVLERMSQSHPVEWLEGLLVGAEALAADRVVVDAGPAREAVSHTTDSTPGCEAGEPASAPPSTASVPSRPRLVKPPPPRKAKPLTAADELHRQARALIELDSPISARGLRSAMDLVDDERRWAGVRAALVSDPDVAIEGKTNALTYRWARAKAAKA